MSTSELKYISKINEWCQKNKRPFPEWQFDLSSNGFMCSVTNGDEQCISDYYKTKKEAKEEAAMLLYESISSTPESNNKISILLDNFILLVDGDQRADVANWLETQTIPEDSEVHLFLSPVSSVSSDKFTCHIAKSTSRDSTDANLLIFLGKIMFSDKQIIIVSSDHILVQAGIDHGLKWAKDLKQLQSLIC